MEYPKSVDQPARQKLYAIASDGCVQWLKVALSGLVLGSGLPRVKTAVIAHRSPRSTSAMPWMFSQPEEKKAARPAAGSTRSHGLVRAWWLEGGFTHLLWGALRRAPEATAGLQDARAALRFAHEA